MSAVALPESMTVPTSYAGDSDVALAAAGDRRAFERLYRLHVSRVFSLCARMVTDRTRAEELTQDVFVRAWEKLHLFRGESAFGTWLHRMTVNVVLNCQVSCAALVLWPSTVRVASAPAPPTRSSTTPSTMSVPPFQVPMPALTLVA